MDFTTHNGMVDFELASTIIVDTTDGYLSNVEGVEYQGAGSDPTGLTELAQKLTSEGETEVEKDVIGGQLLSTLSQMHSVMIDKTIKDQETELVLHRLNKQVDLTENLSEAYAQTDPYYKENYHEDIVSICEAIRDA